MWHDILTAIPWGLLLAFSIGPGFFVLLETSITKGFRAAFTLDLGIVFADIIFILIAYLSTNQLLEQLKDNPFLFIIGGFIMLAYGVISFILLKRNFKKKQEIIDDEDNIQKNNYFALFFKGFLLNFINIGVLGFWLMIIITYGPQMEMNTSRISLFFTAILFFYLLFDTAKILLAKQLKHKLTPQNIYKIKRVISMVILIFGLFFMLQGFFPKEKEKIKEVIEKFKK
ncbi:lysine transporter LysE [Flavobacterium sp. 316]|uniref:LysE family transporter n=1 Tax=Flavobacterium sediminilitoris TaxID=2024526 RepID=A0ABY4HQE7_9FLAO|nr:MULTISPECIES: LysE family transporter [Flavobacterium]KIX20521.1 lysine transporter LysE [Flavobacterium sp. 316]UOX34915.1 LysE family transporter [Flavobacterium sediminilitoris]